MGPTVRGPTCTRTRCMAWVWVVPSWFLNPQSSGRPARSTPPKREVKSTKGRTGYSPTPPVTNPRVPSGAKPKSARAAMERRGQQPGDAQQPGKDGAGDSPPPPPPFLEVSCRSSGKVRRFAAGTTARYALHAINRKLGPGAPPALHVEAVRDGEEPVSFGPSAALADYGRGWRLQTVTAHDAPGIHHAPHADTKQGDRQPSKEDAVVTETVRATCIYVAKIVLAFAFLFLLGGSLTYLLEVIPDMLQTASALELPDFFYDPLTENV